MIVKGLSHLVLPYLLVVVVGGHRYFWCACVELEKIGQNVTWLPCEHFLVFPMQLKFPLFS